MIIKDTWRERSFFCEIKNFTDDDGRVQSYLCSEEILKIIAVELIISYMHVRKVTLVYISLNGVIA